MSEMPNEKSLRKNAPKRPRMLWWVVGGSVAALAIAALFAGGAGSGTDRYVTAPVERADLVATVATGGSLTPSNPVDVGTEVSGTILEVLAEDNDRVVKGQLLARIDPSRLADSVERSLASVASATASEAQASASHEEALAAKARLARLAKESAGRLPSEADRTSSLIAEKKARAALATARANREAAEATLRSDRTSLEKASIRSPMDGVVLARRVEPGQTVAASLNAPVLFALAGDLTRMELAAKVDEADVASVRPGQKASFTVSAWPGRKFDATVKRVGLGAFVSDGVVVYKTLLFADNADEALRPGMTASARIVVNEKKAVLLIPKAALRFAPRPEETKKSFMGKLAPRRPTPRQPALAPSAGKAAVWVIRQEGTAPERRPVELGSADADRIEVLSGLTEGERVVLDQESGSGAGR